MTIKVFYYLCMVVTTELAMVDHISMVDHDSEVEYSPWSNIRAIPESITVVEKWHN